MYIWGKGRAAGRVGSGQTFCRQSRVGSGRVNFSAGRVGSGPRKVTRGQLCDNLPDMTLHTRITVWVRYGLDIQFIWKYLSIT